MKKFLFIISSFLFLFVPVFQTNAGNLEKPLENAVNNVVDELFGEGPVPDGSFVLPCPEEFNEIGDNTSARQFILNVVNFVLSFLGIVATIMIIYAGYLYVTAGGGEGAEKAKKIILYAVVGIIVILISFALVNTVIRNAGTGGDDRLNVQGQTFTGSDIQIPDYCNTGSGSAVKPTIIDGGLVKVEGTGVTDMGNMAAASLDAGIAGLKFTFTPAGQKTLWDFGDGIRSTEETPTHKYGKAGAYQVNVMKETSEGIVGSAKVIIIGGVQASFKTSSVIVAGEATTFDASSSRAVVGSIVSYEWKSEPSDAGVSGQKGAVITPTFSQEGTYTITLTVESNLGIKAETKKIITVRKAKPIADFTVTNTNNLENPSEYVLDASTSQNLSGTTSNLSYTWTVDGVEQTATEQKLTYAFPTSGSKTVKLVVTDTSTGKQVLSEEKEVTVADVKTFAVTFDPPKKALMTGVDFTFVAQNSSGGSDVTYEWTFPGDIQFVGIDADSAKKMAEVHAYFTKSGVYDVTLVGTKGSEKSDPVTKKIYVQAKGEPLAVIVANGAEGELTSPATVQRPVSVTFTSQSIDEQGNVGESASLTQTWSVDGQVVASADKVSEILTQAKVYIRE